MLLFCAILFIIFRHILQDMKANSSFQMERFFNLMFGNCVHATSSGQTNGKKDEPEHIFIEKNQFDVSPF